MAEKPHQLMSNRVVIFIATLLAVGILLDGKVYNRTPPAQSIYPINDARSIMISKNNQIIMSFENHTDGWLQTKPNIAPVTAERVQFLIDSNHQTNRNYATQDLPIADLFGNAVEMNIDGYLFALGPVEPVSKLRYVLAENKVYLQADHVLPMLQAGTSAFVDLTITTDVHEVKIDNKKHDDSNSWTNLKALGVIERQKIHSDAITSVSVKQNNNSKQFNLHRQDGTTILVGKAQAFGYIISPQQNTSLGLADFH